MRLASIIRVISALVSGIVLAGTGTSAFAQAQDYPNRPIRLIVPAAPGGTTDGLARIFGGRLTDMYGQQVVVDNRASQSGVVAGEVTAQAAPDGYTLFLPYHQHTINAALLPKLPYHPINDFTPITQLTAAGLILVVHPDTPVKNFKEFLAWTKSQGGKLNFGSAGIGSGGHLAGELFNQLTGAKAQHIPYKGTGPATAGLLGKEYHYNFMGLLAGSRLAKEGRLRALGVTSGKRSEGLPDIPTIAEQGLPGFEVVGWYGPIAPAKMSKPLLEKLHKEFVTILNEPEMKKAIFNQGAETVGNSPEEFRKYLIADLAKWHKVVKASKA
ncbi:MAG TPA: tripartite tricarboxylate transporter substrate binding protein, partial [Longimicrobiales bacterium]